jgi:hypothetical protein
MALAQNNTTITWAAADHIDVASAEVKVSDVINVGTLTATGVAVGLAVHFDCTYSAHAARSDTLEILTSPDGTNFDYGAATSGNPYASYVLTTVNNTSGLGVTIPLAFAETIRYFKVRIAAGTVTSSSGAYTAVVVKTTA